MKARVRILCSALLLCSVSAFGVALFGGDHPGNQQNPPNGAPWRYVAQLGNQTASGVYLGKRFIITANHVAQQDLTPVLLNGVSYQRDLSFPDTRIGNDDIRLFRIVGNPGLPAMPLIAKKDPEFNRKATVVGCGYGTGTEIAGQGWQRNNARVRRWGTNTTFGRYVETADGIRLATAFNANVGPNETSLMLGDSGGALFIKYAGKWKLAGVAVDNDDVEQALYDRDPAQEGDQPDRAFYVPMKLHRQEIRAIISAAKP
jgi:hypothetical protein